MPTVTSSAPAAASASSSTCVLGYREDPRMSRDASCRSPSRRPVSAACTSRLPSPSLDGADDFDVVAIANLSFMPLSAWNDVAVHRHRHAVALGAGEQGDDRIHVRSCSQPVLFAVHTHRVHCLFLG